MTNRVLRACDGCRVRKVRCNGDQPCPQCSHLGLKCVFAPPPAKRKPGVRGRLVAQLRSSQAHGTPVPLPNFPSSSTSTSAVPTRSSDSSPTNSSSHSPGTAPSVTSIAGIVNSGASPIQYHSASSSGGFGLPLTLSSPLSGNVVAVPARYNHDFFVGFLPGFEEQVYPVNPIVSPSEMRNSIHNMHADYQDAALVYAYAAVTINLTQGSWKSSSVEDVASEMSTLMELSMLAHKHAEAVRNSEHGRFGEFPVSLKRIATCFYLEITMMAFKRHDRALAMLREAITMIQILNPSRFTSDGDFPAFSSSSPASPSAATEISSLSDVFRLRRAYWEAYIHERFLSTVTGFPCILPTLNTGIPVGDASIPAHIDAGWARIIHLFCSLDGPFLAHWSAQKDPSLPVPEMTAEWIESKQAELDADEADTDEADRELTASGRGSFTELQLADLLVTRLWLRTLVWQFALSHGLLRSAPGGSAHDGLSLHFPAQRLSAQLRTLVGGIKIASSIIFHGSGIIQKLFEITSTVADVLALPLGPGQTQEEFRVRLQDFEYLVRFIFGFERIQKEQRDYLREKLVALQAQYTIVDFSELASLSPSEVR